MASRRCHISGTISGKWNVYSATIFNNAANNTCIRLSLTNKQSADCAHKKIIISAQLKIVWDNGLFFPADHVMNIALQRATWL